MTILLSMLGIILFSAIAGWQAKKIPPLIAEIKRPLERRQPPQRAKNKIIIYDCTPKPVFSQVKCDRCGYVFDERLVRTYENEEKRAVLCLCCSGILKAKARRQNRV